MSEPIKKKRGRKPKAFPVVKPNEEQVVKQINSEEEKLILHLPITMNEIHNSDNDNRNDEELDIFIKPDDVHISNDSDSIELLKIDKSCVTILNKFQALRCWNSW